MKLSRTLRQATYKAMGKKPILQFGIPRSGSTLIYNLLRELFTDHYVIKSHALRAKDLELPIVATYRNPLDVMASVFECQQLTVSDEEIRRQLFLLSKHGLWDVFELQHRPNALLLRYETFSRDFGFIFDELERFVGQPISTDRRQALSDKYDIARVKQSIDPGQDFSHKDKTTMFHGRHISRHEGRAGYYEQVFNEEQISYMQRYFRFYMEELGY